MDLSLILALVVLGLVVGFAAGLLGIGGGLTMVPLLTFALSSIGVGVSLVVHMAIATSLATIFFTSISSVYAHHRRGAILWHVALLLIPGVVLGSWIGPVIAASLNTRYLAGVFAVFVAFSAIRMLQKKKPGGGGGVPGASVLSAAGLGIGVLSGLLGAGGGFITVPFLTWRGVRIHNAVATSAVMGFPIALSGTLSNIYQGWDVAGLPAGSLGFVYVPAVLSIAAASVVSAPFGARTAHRMDVAQLRTVFAYLLLVLSLYMLWKAITA